MRALTLLLLAAAACDSEHGFVEELPEIPEEPEVEEGPEDPIAPEVPRFYFVDVPWAPAVSDDGVVLMHANQPTADGGSVYLWTEEEGLEWVTSTGTWRNEVHDISAEGNTVIGSMGDYTQGEATQAAVWTRDEGWTSLGALPDTLDCPMQSAGYGLSADASLATGLAYSGCDGRAFLWDASGGLVALERLGEGSNRASTISRDGSTVAGFAQGDSSRTPALWNADGSGEILDARFTGEFYDLNQDGTVGVGQLGTKAFVWTRDSGHVLVDPLGGSGGSSGTALSVCGHQDELVIGTDTLAGGQAFVWRDGEQTRSMHDWLEALGMTLPDGVRLLGATACTPDLTHFVGWGADEAGSGAWVAVFPEGHVADALAR